MLSRSSTSIRRSARPQKRPAHADSAQLALAVPFVIGLASIGIAAITVLAGPTASIIRTLMILALATQAAFTFWTLRHYWPRAHGDFLHPLVFVNLVGVFPMNILRGLQLLMGHTSSVAHVLGSSSDYYFTLAFAAACSGMAALSIGFSLAQAHAILALRYKLPDIRTSGLGVKVSILLGLLIGLLAKYGLLVSGQYGSSLGSYSSAFLPQTSVLIPLANMYIFSLFLLIFRGPAWGKSFWWKLAIFLQAILVMVLTVLSGGRAVLYSYALVAIGAYYYSRIYRKRKLPVFRIAAFTVLAIVLGVLIGSTFREYRSIYRGEQISEAATVGVALSTIDALGQIGIYEQSATVVERISERLTAMDNFSVTLMMAQELQDEERVVGMNNNILKEGLYSLIPRPVWPGKPTVSDIGLSFTRVYLRSPARSWAGPSLFGDLYRNFGYVGIGLGMFLLGVYLGAIYRVLIKNNHTNALACGIYFMLLVTVGYEGWYTAFITSGMRVMFMVGVFFLVAMLLGGVRRGVA